MWLDDVKLIEDDQIHRVTPMVVAQLFCDMDAKQQAEFFNSVAEIASKWSASFPMQIQYVTDEEGLTLAGRRVMQSIGEYSHWGLVP